MPIARRWRLVLIVLAVIVAVVVGAALLVPSFIDAERYRGDIARVVEEVTGRRLKLGEISVSLVPRPALRVRGVAVSEGPLYPDRDALRIERLDLRLGVWSLLRGRVDIAVVILDRPVLTLIRDQRGRWNYDDLLERVAAPSGKEDAAPRRTEPRVVIRRAVVRSGKVLIYDDAVTPGARAEAVIGPVDAVVRGWGAGGESDLDLALKLGGGTLRVTARLDSTGKDTVAVVNVAPSALAAADLTALLPWLGVMQPAGMECGGGFEIRGAATVPLDRPETIRFEGQIRVDDLSYRDASMADPLTRIGGVLEVDGEHAIWKGFTARLGSSVLAGQLQVEDFLRPRIGFTLSSERLDLNELLAAFAAGPAADTGAPDNGSAGGPTSPDGLLDPITARGTIAFEALRFLNFDLAGVRASAGLERSVVSLGDVEAGLYGGRLLGSVSLDLNRAPPAYRLDARLEGIDVDPVLSAYDPGLAGLLRGRLSGDLGLDASGTAMQAIISSARGRGALEMTEGTLRSFSVLAQTAKLLEQAGGKGIGREETPFEYLRGTMDIAGGKARTSDLVLRSADLDLGGEGWVALDGTVSLAVAARFSKEATAGMAARTPRVGSLADGEGRLAVHLLAEGPLAAPRISLDTRAQVKDLTTQQRERAEEKLKNQLRDRLRKRFGQTEEDEEKPPE